MPEYEGLIKYPLAKDLHGTSYGQPQWWKDLAVTTRAEIEARAQRGAQKTLTTSDHLDNIRKYGYYEVPSAAIAIAVGAPLESVGGVLVETTGYSHFSVPDTIVRQTMWDYRTPRRVERIGNSDGTWGPWNDTRALALTTSSRLDNIREHGYYQIPTPAIATAAGAPVASVGGVMVESSGYSHFSQPDTYVRQTMWDYRTNAKMERTGLSNGTWGRWHVGVVRDDIASGGVEHLARQDDYTNRAGGTVYTGGVGAVAFTFDHGLTKFAANNLAQEFLDRGWTFGLALNSRTMTLPENAGASVAQVKSWSKAEIWNHGATHSAQTTEAGVYDEIVNGKAELETMFERDIHGYIPAGTGPVGLDGFDGGFTPESWGTYAGQLILRHHALTTGYLGSGVRPLDGQVRQGVVRWTMDSMTLARVKLEIDNAVAGKTGAMFMLHPSRLDSEGFMSTATLLAALDYAKSLETAGNLRVLAPSELLHASSAVADVTGLATRLDALERDTGWRKLATTHASAARTGGTVTVKRRGDKVRMRFVDATVPDGSGPVIVVHPAELPLGFTVPAIGTVATVGNGIGSTHLNYLRANGSWWWIKQEQTTTPSLSRAGVALSGEIEWTTDDPWPTTLPGSAA